MMESFDIMRKCNGNLKFFMILISLFIRKAMTSKLKTKNKAFCVLTIIFSFFLVTISSGKEGTKMGELSISSPAFQHNGTIPVQYTCDGKDISPPLVINGTPKESKSLVLIVDDPDAPAGTWVHWVVWNIKPGTKEIQGGSVPAGSAQGINDFGRHDYGGPCPPSGVHRYFFKLYALDTALDLSPNSRKADVEGAMKGHIIEESQIIGLYKRR
jgi:Raf kinase inhibitor-like YbhB/YbcL family protein